MPATEKKKQKNLLTVDGASSLKVSSHPPYPIHLEGRKGDPSRDQIAFVRVYVSPTFSSNATYFPLVRTKEMAIAARHIDEMIRNPTQSAQFANILASELG